MKFADLSDRIKDSFLNNSIFLSFVILTFHYFCNYVYPPMLDPRTKDWWLMKNDKFMLTLVLSYFYFVRIIGPRWMKNRKPYDLRSTLLVYNVFQVIVSIYTVAYQLSHTFLGGGYSFICQGMDYSTDYHPMSAVVGNYWYLYVRIADFLDTIFFVLRKKHRNVSSLHVLHHTMVVYDGWFFIKYGSDGQPMLGIIVNATIHIVMYTYYFLAALGPHTRKYLWWKKYLTQAQILQFIFLFAYALIPVFKDCAYRASYTTLVLCIPQGIIGTLLFLNFYYQRYVRPYEMKSNGVANGYKLK